MLDESAASFQTSLGDQCLETCIDAIIVGGPHVDHERVKSGLEARLGDLLP